MAIENLKEKIQGVYENTNNLYPLLKELGEQAGEVPDPLEVDEIKVKKFGAFKGTSRYVDMNPTNETTALYGNVKIGSAETPTPLEVNGDVTMNGEVEMGADAMFGETMEQAIKDAVFPDPTGHLGEVLTHITTGETWQKVQPNSIEALPFTTTEPTEANTNGIKIAVLSAEPATKYAGWLYLITA